MKIPTIPREVMKPLRVALAAGYTVEALEEAGATISSGHVIYHELKPGFHQFVARTKHILPDPRVDVVAFLAMLYAHLWKTLHKWPWVTKELTEVAFNNLLDTVHSKLPTQCACECRKHLEEYRKDHPLDVTDRRAAALWIHNFHEHVKTVAVKKTPAMTFDQSMVIVQRWLSATAKAGR